MNNIHLFRTKKKNLAFLKFKNEKIECYVGLNGIGKKTREGDKKTPVGVYRFLKVFYRPEKVQNFKANLPIQKIKKNSFWCVDSKSINYNTFQQSRNFECENLYRSDSVYDVIITIDFNINPIKKFKGSAIFIHCHEKKKYTEGCVALKLKDILKILRIIKRSSLLIIH